MFQAFILMTVDKILHESFNETSMIPGRCQERIIGIKKATTNTAMSPEISTYIVVLGGLVVIVLATGPKVRRLKP
jgi:uncharacterized ion transporter superfamily protein YfcC